MAESPKQAGSSANPRLESKKTKLARLPTSAKIRKRPILRPAIPSPYSSAASPKVVYVSQKTPFIATVKRVRKLLNLANKRVVQSKLENLPGPPADEIRAAAEARVEPDEQERVWIKATGRSIEKALNLAMYFQQQDEHRVELKTGSVWAIDDILEDDPMPDADNDDQDAMDDGEPLPETRLRPVSVLEVGISLR